MAGGTDRERTHLISAEKGNAPGAAPAPTSSDDSVETLHALILHQLDEDQAQETISIPTADKSSTANHMITSSGRPTLHPSSLLTHLVPRKQHEAGPHGTVEAPPHP